MTGRERDICTPDDAVDEWYKLHVTDETRGEDEGDEVAILHH